MGKLIHGVRKGSKNADEENFVEWFQQELDDIEEVLRSIDPESELQDQLETLKALYKKLGDLIEKSNPDLYDLMKDLIKEVKTRYMEV